MEERILVGMDLCEDYTQLTCCRVGGKEPESIGDLIPTRLAVKRGAKDWVYGEEAERLLKTGDAIEAGPLLAKAEKNEETRLYDVVFGPEELLERYFRKLLVQLRQEYPDARVGRLVVTLEEQAREDRKRLEENIYLAFEKIGIQRERVQVQSHMTSFLHYTIAQERSLWQNDTALFEFRRGSGLHYAQLSINRKEKPMVAAITERDYTDYLKLEQVLADPVEAGRIYTEVAEMAVHRKLLSAVYAVGRGFEGDWADPALQKLCAGRKVFKGQNLYAKGACYAAGHQLEENEEKVLFLGEEHTSAQISMQLYLDGRSQEHVLIPAAVRWQEAGGEWDLILDREEELVLLVSDYVSKTKAQYVIPLEGLPKRERKMTRIRLRLCYTELHSCLVQVRELGFGEFVPTEEAGCGRVWESMLPL